MDAFCLLLTCGRRLFVTYHLEGFPVLDDHALNMSRAGLNPEGLLNPLEARFQVMCSQTNGWAHNIERRCLSIYVFNISPLLRSPFGITNFLWQLQHTWLSW